MSNVVTPILFLVISIGLFFAYIKPAYNNLQEFQSMETELDRAITEADRLVAHYEDLLKKKRSISSQNMERINKILPDSIDIIQLIIDIDSLTTSNELSINSFEIPHIMSDAELLKRKKKDSDDESIYNSAILTVELVGDYAKFKEFLVAIEKSVSLVDTVNLEITVEDPTYRDEYKKNIYKVGLQAYWINQ